MFWMLGHLSLGEGKQWEARDPPPPHSYHGWLPVALTGMQILPWLVFPLIATAPWGWCDLNMLCFPPSLSS